PGLSPHRAGAGRDGRGGGGGAGRVPAGQRAHHRAVHRDGDSRGASGVPVIGFQTLQFLVPHDFGRTCQSYICRCVSVFRSSPDGLNAATRGLRGADRNSCSSLKEIDMASGTVKWFNSDKGFGFIEQDGGGADFFAHYSNLVSNGGYRELHEGQKVSFDVVQGQKGPQAENIVAA